MTLPSLPRPIPGIVIGAFDQGRVALVKRANAPFADHWALPGGSLEMGETLEAGALRELSEETGLVAARAEFAGFVEPILRNKDGIVVAHYVLAIFGTASATGVLAADDDAAEARWVTVGELTRYLLTPNTKESIRKAAAACNTVF